MTLTPTRPVPEAATPEQQRLEVELLLGERLLTPLELATADLTLLAPASGIPADRWRALGALPLRQAGNTLVVAVPSH